MDHLNPFAAVDHVSNLRAIPHEFRSGYWAVSSLVPNPDGKPDKAPKHPLSGNPLDVTLPLGGGPKERPAWATFDQCLEAVASGLFPAMGRLLRREDGFTVIDLDDPDKATDPVAARADQASLESKLVGIYVETSTSGKGRHYILRGSFDAGGARDSASQIEVYCDERYIITTGVGGGAILTAGAGLLDAIVAAMGSSSNPLANLGDLKGARLSVEEAVALGGVRLDRYLAGYPIHADRSVYDFKPLGILATYEVDPRVAVEIFMQSPLASPERIAQKRVAGETKFREYVRNSYIKLLGKQQAKRIRRERLHAAMIHPGVAGAKQVYAQMLDEGLSQPEVGEAWVAALVESDSLRVGSKTIKELIAITEADPAEIAEDDHDEAVIDDAAASWATPCDPRTAPGLIGLGAREHQDHRAARDTAFPGYLAHLLAVSTIMGFAFRSTFKDKPDFANLQILAALPSLYGKEDIIGETNWAIGVAKSVGMQIGFATSYASGPAAHTAFSATPYQCYIEDEAGRKSQQQRKAGGDPHQMGLSTFFMELYNRYKIEEKPYSDRASVKPEVPYVFGTMLRMSQPETLAPTLDKGNLSDGLLTRPYFIHEPKLPDIKPYGQKSYSAPSPRLTDTYKVLASWSRQANYFASEHAKFAAEKANKKGKEEETKRPPGPMPAEIRVIPTGEAEAVYASFLNFCEKQAQAGYTIWGRASQNAKRLGMVLAVGEEALTQAQAGNALGKDPALAPTPHCVSISRETMIWACAEIAGRLRSLGKYATEEIHGGNTESQIAAEVEKYLGKHGGRALVTKLAGGLAKNGQKDFEYERIKRVILGMVESGRLVGDAPVSTGAPMPRGLKVALPSSRKR